MKLFANGCSFTWGGAIYPSLHDCYGESLDYYSRDKINQKRLNDVWPQKLAKKMNIDECVNLSLGCGSNSRILRSSLDFFTYEMTENRMSDDWIAIIQWTQAHRYEYWDEDSQSWAMVIPSGTTTSRFIKYEEMKKLDKHLSNTYAYLNDKTYAQWYWSQVVSLAAFFDQNKIRYWFTNLSTDHMGFLGAWQQQYLREKINWINDDMYSTIGMIFQDRHDSGSGHPSLLGHDQIAQSIYCFLERKL